MIRFSVEVLELSVSKLVVCFPLSEKPCSITIHNSCQNYCFYISLVI